MTAEEYIKNFTRGCSNELENGEYEYWLTPWQTEAACNLKKEETIEKVCKWFEGNKDNPFIGCEDPCLSGYLTDQFIADFRNYMKGK